MNLDPTTQQTQQKSPIRSALALSLKELIWRYGIRFSPTKRPIAVYATRRSGSSLLMETICVNPGIVFSDQPFGLYTASSATINRLPIFPYGQLAYPDPDEELLLRHYVEDLLSGKIRANYPWKFWRKDFHLRNDRICLKITDAKTMIDWLATQFNLQTVVLTRHPVAQALSVANAGWYPTGKGLLRNQQYVDHWLDSSLEAYSWDVYRGGSWLQWRVLDWALENLPMLRQLSINKDWLYVSYEDLMVHTAEVVRYLCERLELPSRQSMIDRINEPSRATRRESTVERQQLIADGDRRRLVDSWQSKVDKDQVRACFRVLNRFQLGLYHADSPYPDARCVARPGFDQLPSHAIGS